MSPAATSALVVGLCVGQVTGGYPIHPVGLEHVDIKDSFWLQRLQTNCEVTVWHNIEQCEKTGRFANFAVAAKL